MVVLADRLQDRSQVAHRPVLLDQALQHLAVRPDGVYVDATVGLGGHAWEICLHLRTGRLIALDRDPCAVELSRQALSQWAHRVCVVHANFADLDRILDELRVERVDGVLFDLGVSSMQLSLPDRGFSFQLDGPLDMRMDPSSPRTAAEIVNHATEAELVKILRIYGEERYASAIARAMLRSRQRRPLRTTRELAELVCGAVPPRRRGRKSIHPATRTFQALRIAVNDELGCLQRALHAAFARLVVGGRLVVISFHSLEDRLVKRFFASKAKSCICPPRLPLCRCGKMQEAEIWGPITPALSEISRNPRARSAKLRAASRLSTTPHRQQPEGSLS